jgi:hypothetical protein
MRFRLALPGMLLLAALPTAIAHAGAVSGTLWMSASAAAQSRNAKVAVRVSAQRGVTESVIYLEKVPDNIERKLSGKPSFWFFRRPAPPRPSRIVQKDMRFFPRVLAIAAGTQVEFQNLDRVYHNAFSVSTAKRFDLGKYPPGQIDTVLFERPGVINLHCDIHPEMLGFIVVTPNHAIVRPDSVGSFVLPKLPAGNYTLHAWNPHRPELKQAFEVPNRGDVNLNLRF